MPIPSLVLCRRYRPGTIAGVLAFSTVCVSACSSSTEPMPEVDRPILFMDAWRLYVTADSGGPPVGLMTDPALRAFYATWSPRGTHVAMVAEDSTGFRALYVLDARGDGRTQVSDPSTEARGAWSWSPDGERIVFTGPSGELYVAHRGGTGQALLTAGDSWGKDPHWSPAGDWITYQGGDSSGNGIFRVRPDGSDRMLLADVSGSVRDATPRFSPDGARLAYTIGQDVHVMNADGTGKDALTVTPSEGDWYPRWSPDGSQIALHVDAGSNWAIGILDVATKRITDTIPNASSPEALNPSWAPDGRRIVFVAGYNAVVVAEIGAPDSWHVIGSGRHAKWHPGG